TGARASERRPDPQPTSSTRLRRRGSSARSARKRGLTRTAWIRLGTRRPRLLGLEVLGLGVVEDQRRDRGLRVHHEALGETEPDLPRIEQVEQDALIGEVRARRVAEGNAEPAVVGLELFGKLEAGRIREAPLGAQPRVEHLREGLRALDGQGLEGVRAQVLAL